MFRNDTDAETGRSATNKEVTLSTAHGETRNGVGFGETGNATLRHNWKPLT